MSDFIRYVLYELNNILVQGLLAGLLAAIVIGIVYLHSKDVTGEELLNVALKNRMI